MKKILSLVLALSVLLLALASCNNNNQTSSNLNVHIAEGDINGEINAVVTPDGKVIAASEKKNALAVSLQNIISNE